MDHNFQKIKSGINKQNKTREVAEEEVTYVDSGRNIAVVLGLEDLRENLNEQGLSTALVQDEGGVQACDLLRREAVYHFN